MGRSLFTFDFYEVPNLKGLEYYVVFNLVFVILYILFRATEYVSNFNLTSFRFRFVILYILLHETLTYID